MAVGRREAAKGGATMLAVLDPPEIRDSDRHDSELGARDLEALVVAMGKRLQAEYIEGAIPYLREREPALWTELEALDRDESLSALLAYERLFFEGLRRYCDFLCHFSSSSENPSTGWPLRL
jgi:hypothetical protein